jgi:MraZ protein
MGNYLELWDDARYRAKEAAVLEQPMPEALQDFTF